MAYKGEEPMMLDYLLSCGGEEPIWCQVAYMWVASKGEEPI